jgi:hypothetical protein
MKGLKLGRSLDPTNSPFPEFKPQLLTRAVSPAKQNKAIFFIASDTKILLLYN